MNDLHNRPKIGVMGAARGAVADGERARLAELAERLAIAIAAKNCILVTGATTGLPDLVSRATRLHGGLTIGISPAHSKQEHVETYLLPADGADVIIYTGFGLKGRNVVNIRTSDVVIIFGGGMGTLNEFTIAYDEGKVIGVLEGTGGITAIIEEIVAASQKPTRSRLLFDREPESLIESCLRAFEQG